MPWGLSRKRSPLGKWLDNHGFQQEDLVQSAKVSRNTASKACSNPDYRPSPGVRKNILNAIREIDPNIKQDDFWPM